MRLNSVQPFRITISRNIHPEKDHYEVIVILKIPMTFIHDGIEVPRPGRAFDLNRHVIDYNIRP